MEQPRELTEEEVRDNFLDHVRNMVFYWQNQQKQGYPINDCIEGVAFSLLVAIDGGTSLGCSFILAPMPHEENKEYNIENGENYYPENHNSDVKCDIGGSLHEHFYKK